MIVLVKGLSYSYSDGQKALDNINLKIRKGRKTALLGLNGSGKSTLLLHLNGSKEASEGKVEVLGLEVKKKNLPEIRRKVGFLFDFPDHQLFSTTVYQDLKFGLDNFSFPKELRDEQIKITAKRLGIEDLLDRPPYQLSLGQKKKVALAGLMVLKPEVLVCDEPFSGLDGPSILQFKKILDQWISQGRSIIFSSHDVDLIYDWADDVVVLSDGKLIDQGPVSEILTKEGIYMEAGLVRPLLYELYEEKSFKPRNALEAKKYINNYFKAKGLK